MMALAWGFLTTAPGALVVAAPVQKEPEGEHVIRRDAHMIAVNQVGYEKGRPNRFSAPLTEDGTPFIVRPRRVEGENRCVGGCGAGPLRESLGLPQV